MKTTILLMLVLTIASVSTAQNGGWEQMESMNTAREGTGSCVIDSKIYVFGGFTGIHGVTASVEVYDIDNNKWTELKTMDQAKASICCEVFNDKIYVMGGWARINNQWQSINTNLEYDYETDNYVEKQSMPIDIGFGASCVYNDSIYTLGGLSRSLDNTTKSWIYDPNTDTWDSIRSMNFQHGGANAQVINNKIYVVGGVEGIPDTEDWDITEKVEMYDPVSNSWEEKEEILYPSTGVSVVHNGKILVFGGDTGYFESEYSTGSTLIQEYDPATNTWEQKHGMPFIRGSMICEKVGKYVYIIGGMENGRVFTEPYLSDVWRFNLDYLQDYDPEKDWLLNSITAIEENKIAGIFTLHQNYPNPFRENTQIKYDLQQAGVVRLQVFNFLGQEVATLVNNHQGPGSYEATWVAEDVKPGIYFVRLKAGDFGDTRKVVVY